MYAYSVKNFIGILQNPSGTVPLLSNDGIYSVLTGSIEAYLNKKISLKMLMDIAAKIRIFSGMRENQSSIENALQAINTLKKHVVIENNASRHVDETLTTISNTSSEKFQP